MGIFEESDSFFWTENAVGLKVQKQNRSAGGWGHFISFFRDLSLGAWQVRQFDFSPCRTLIAGYGEGEMAKCVHEQQKLDGS